jgi:hypothetical protein
VDGFSKSAAKIRNRIFGCYFSQKISALRCEYRQVNHNLRHFNASRLAAIGVFLVIFLIALLFTFSNFRVVWGIGAVQRTNAKALWVFLTLIFLAFDVYAELNVQQLRKIA